MLPFIAKLGGLGVWVLQLTKDGFRADETDSPRTLIFYGGGFAQKASPKSKSPKRCRRGPDSGHGSDLQSVE